MFTYSAPSVPCNCRSTFIRLGLVLSLVLGWLGFIAPNAQATPTSPLPSYYLALGDSLAAGFTTTPGPGYVDDLFHYYQAADPGLRLANFGCPNETSVSFIGDDPHDPPKCDKATYGGLATNQLDAAEQFLRAHRGERGVITLDIGANDVIGCATDPPPASPGQDPVTGCFFDRATRLVGNIGGIIGGLHETAGPKTPILVMTYYDPLLNGYLSPNPHDRDFANQTGDLAGMLAQFIRTAAEAAGGTVADVAAAFQTADTTLVPTSYGLLPRRVANICTWTNMGCSSTGGNLGDIHANPDGYRLIAATFAAVSPPELRAKGATIAPPKPAVLAQSAPVTTPDTAPPRSSATAKPNAAATKHRTAKHHKGSSTLDKVVWVGMAATLTMVVVTVIVALFGSSRSRRRKRIKPLN